MKHRMFRIVIAVILVFALLVSWSPIRANAVGTEQYVAVVIDKVGFYAQAGAVSTGAAVFGYVLAGIGLVVSTARLIEIMNDYMEWSGELETSIYYYPDGSWSYGVDVGFIDRVRAFAFERGYLVDTGNLTTVVPEGQTYRTFTANAPCVAFMYSYSYYTPSMSQYYFAKSGYLVCSVPDYQFSVNGNKATSTVKFNDNSYYCYGIYSGAQYLNKAELTAALSQPSDFYYVGDCGTTYTLSKVLKNYGWGGIQGTGDIATDYVASPDVSIDIAYPEWYVNARPALQPDTNEEVTVLPIPLNPSVAPETQIGKLTQPDIWQGSIADPMPQPDPDTPVEPPSDIADYQIDLTSFFPFCLPFDIYSFFELLAAEPETPHLEFDIELPFMQEPWHVVIDLSAWDSTALLARRLELLAFIIGLCVFTREKFLRS